MKRGDLVFIFVLPCLLCLMALAIEPRKCNPRLVDGSARVLEMCGRPTTLRSVETSYGAQRQEWEYSRLVVLEDGRVIGGAQ